MVNNLFKYFNDRGLINQFSHANEIEKVLNEEKITFYIGFDPTAESLHIGSLVPLIFMKRLVENGHKAICLIGDGTALVGDPSGKTEMRKMLDNKTLKHNAKLIEKQIKSIIPEVKIFVHNSDWLNKISYISFLREFGPIFKVNEMIKAETYKIRLDNNDSLSFLEFNYQILQAYDFLHLYNKYKCKLQIGGSDQWSNILAGVELIRKLSNGDSYALTLPLLTNSEGKKMGKTEKGAVWLNKEKTSPYEFFQYWVNVDDADVKKFLKIFTSMNLDEIDSLDFSSYENIKTAKELLAMEVTSLVHGKKEAELAKITSKKMFDKNQSNPGEDGGASLPINEIPVNLIKESPDLPDILVKLGLVSSKSQARQLIVAGGVYINKEKIDKTYNIENLSVLNSVHTFRIGKKKYHIIKVIG